MDQFLFSLAYTPAVVKGKVDYKRECLVGAVPPPIDPLNVNQRDVKSGYLVVAPLVLDTPITVTLPSGVYRPGFENDPTRPVSYTISEMLVTRGWIDRNQVNTYIFNRLPEALPRTPDGSIIPPSDGGWVSPSTQLSGVTWMGTSPPRSDDGPVMNENKVRLSQHIVLSISICIFGPIWLLCV